MKYVIIGAGGTGGILGFYMTKAGKDVTLIARNAHLAAMKEQGLTVRHLWDGTTETVQVKAENMETYESMIASAGEAAKPDVILVCVKGYSLDNTVPFVQKIAKKSTIVIPILNIYGTGSRLQKKLPELLVTDGCIYVSANIEGPGALVQHGKILRVVFGVREKSEFREELKEIAKDFSDSGISGELSENIRRDALEKFSYVSPIGAAGLYYHATAADFQREGEEREAFKAISTFVDAKAVVVTNVFRDQLDRYGEVTHTLDNIRIGIGSGIHDFHAEGCHGRKTVGDRRTRLRGRPHGRGVPCSDTGI